MTNWKGQLSSCKIEDWKKQRCRPIPIALNPSFSNINDKGRANCSQTTGERLASSVVSHGLGASFSWIEEAWGERSGGGAVGGGLWLHRAGVGIGVKWGFGGGWCGAGVVGGGGGSQPLRTALHTKYKSL